MAMAADATPSGAVATPDLQISDVQNEVVAVGYRFKESVDLPKDQRPAYLLMTTQREGLDEADNPFPPRSELFRVNSDVGTKHLKLGIGHGSIEITATAFDEDGRHRSEAAHATVD
jgi:hypothetical protein